MCFTAPVRWLSVFLSCFAILASLFCPAHPYIVKVETFPTAYPGQLRAVAKIYNIQRMIRQSWREECYGAFIDFRLVMTACSCVSYTDNAWQEITPWFHGNVSQVLPVKSYNLYVGTMLYELHPWKTRVTVQSVLLHPRCDNYYHVDYAMLVLHRRHPRGEPTQLSVAADADLVRGKLKAMSTTLAMDDGCTVFYWRPGPQWSLGQNPVKFQPWDICFEHVCPIYRPPLTPMNPQQQKTSECLNDVGSGSRHCVEWTANPQLCQLPPGAPVFCDFDHFNGVWGLMVNGRYSCPPLGGARGIMNGLDGAIDWIRSVYNAHRSNASETSTAEYRPRWNCCKEE